MILPMIPLVVRSHFSLMRGTASLLLFVLGIGAGHLFDRWHSSITPAEYRHHIRNIESPEYNHFRGRTPPPAVRQTGPDSGPASQPADNK